MCGTYEESAKVVEKLMKLYSDLPMGEQERTSAMNALITARALILKAEEDIMDREMHYAESLGQDRPNKGMH